MSPQERELLLTIAKNLIADETRPLRDAIALRVLVLAVEKENQEITDAIQECYGQV